MKKINFIFLLGSLLLLSLSTYAQMTETARKEFPIDEDYGHFIVEFSDLRSVLYSYRNRDRKADMVYWNFEFWNEDLLPTTKKQLEISEIFDDYTAYQGKDHYYGLFFSRSKGLYEFHDFDMNSRTSKSYAGKFIPKMKIFTLRVIGQKVFISGEYKAKHQIIVLDMATNTNQVYITQEMTDLKLIYSEMQLIESADGNEVAFKYLVCEKKSCEYYVRIFNKDGNPKDGFLIVSKPDEDKELKYASLTKEGNSYLVTGTFGLKKNGMQSGFFFAKNTNSSYEFVKYYNFLDLTDFTSHLSDRKREKIEKKASKAEEKGEELFIDYYATIHNVIEKDNEYVLLAEFYFPTYRTEYSTSYVNGRSVTTSRQVFDGYQYSHAAIAGFDKKGTMLWSNTFQMWLTQKTFSVEQFIRTAFDGNNIELVFVNGLEIKSVSFNKGKIEKSRSVSMIQTNDENDVVKRTTGTDISWWYGQNYLISGSQVIKNSDNDSGKRKREIFFVNKWTY